jgi:hypothetical protein
MQWSKLKTRIKSLVCPELRKRIDFHITSYRESHDGVEKAWITLDGVKIFNCSHYHYQFTSPDGIFMGMSDQECKELLEKHEIHHPRDMVGSMRVYLDISIAQALRSENPFIKSVAIIDRRVGKRARDKINLDGSEHSLVKRFHELRFERPGQLRR